MEWLLPVVLVVVAVVAIGVYLWVSYTSLVQLNARVDEGWSAISEQLERRDALIPGLLDTVRSHVDHEKAVLESVTLARAESLSADTPQSTGVAEGHIRQAMRALFSVADDYPRLQADPTFLEAQQSLAAVNDEVQHSKRFYNGGVRELNTKIRSFPSSLFARALGYPDREFFEVEGGGPALSEPPRVQF